MITKVSEAKLVGVFVTPHCHFNPILTNHVQIFRKLELLKYLKEIISSRYVNMLYNVIVQKKLDCCDVVWGIAAKTCFKGYSRCKSRLPDNTYLIVLMVRPCSSRYAEIPSVFVSISINVLNF